MSDVEWPYFHFFSIFIHFSLIVFVFFWNLCGAKAYAIFDKFYQRLNCCKRDLEVIMIWNHTKVFKVFQIVYIFNGINLTKAMVIIRMQKKMCCPICYENKFRNFRMRFLLFMPDSIVTCGPKRRTAACRRVKRCWEGNCGRKPR